ncbi:MAG TPA: hypothetical protein DCY79_01115, partial [Planctomycetaceae bacterium]|nr:hypothetical protein [Planctomycetaceae bacterium]
MKTIKFAAVIFVSLTCVALVWAAETDELREQAREMQREARKLAERGHEKEAEAFERRAAEMLEEAERREDQRPDRRDGMIRQLRERLAGLRLEERKLEEAGGNDERLRDVRREAEMIERKFREIMRDRNAEHEHHEG